MRFYFIIIVLFLLGCNSDNCDQLVQGETLEISDSTKMFVNNYINAEAIFFENHQSEEVRFVVSEMNETFSSFRFDRECDEDSEKTQTVQTSFEVVEFILINQDNALFDSIYISLSQFPNSMGNLEESLIVTCGNLVANDLNQSDVLLSYDRFETNVNFIDSLNINGTTFFSVYEHDNVDWIPKYDIKYSLNQGIVYLKDNETNLELTYLRVE